MSQASDIGIDTRGALLNAAAERLQQVGWASFSFRDLAAVVGIRAPSIHYHFPTKADLGIALVEWFREHADAHGCALVSDHPDVRDRLRALGRMIAEGTCAQQRSCPIYILQAEFTVLPEAVQRAVRGWIDERLAIVAQWLSEGRAAGHLRFPGDAMTQARVVWSVLQHGTQLSVTHPDESFTALIDHLVASIST